MSLHPYSGTYAPPAPVCTIYLGEPGKEPTRGPLQALIDTGADISIIPVHYLRQLSARPLRQATARSIWGDRQAVTVYAVSLRLDGLEYRALQVLADSQGEEIVLGRNVLNRLYMVLDDPTSQVEVVESRTV